MLMVRVDMECDAGTHEIGVETMEYADSDGVSAAPNAEYATSVGRDDGHASRAQVTRRGTTEAWPCLRVSDGRAPEQPAVDRAYDTELAATARQPERQSRRGPLQERGVLRRIAVQLHAGERDAWFGGSDGPARRRIGRRVGAGARAAAGVARSRRHGALGDRLRERHVPVYAAASDGGRARHDGAEQLQQLRRGGGVGRGQRGDGHQRRYGDALALAEWRRCTWTVDATVVSPTLVSRVVASLDAGAREQAFTTEASVGYLYTHCATYANGDVHVVSDDALSVEVVSPSQVSYALSGGRHRVGVVQDALAATCSEPLLRVSLGACNGSLPAATPPLELQLPLPTGTKPLLLSEGRLGADDSFARSSALQSATGAPGRRQAGDGRDGRQQHAVMLGDARVSLHSSDASCVNRRRTSVSVGALLGGRRRRLHERDDHGDRSRWARGYRTRRQWPPSRFGSPERERVALPFVRQRRDDAVHAARCGRPAVRQQALLQRVVHARGGRREPIAQRRTQVVRRRGDSDTDQPAADVGRRRVRWGRCGCGVARGERARAGRDALADDLDEATLTPSDINPTVATTLVTSTKVAVRATFSGGEGVSCSYSDGQVRGVLGTSIEDIALFSVPAAYSGVLSVATDGTVSALATHRAKAAVNVTNACDGSERRGVIARQPARVGGRARPGRGVESAAAGREKPGGEAVVDLRAPRQAARGAPIETIAAFVPYNSAASTRGPPRAAGVRTAAASRHAAGCGTTGRRARRVGGRVRPLVEGGVRRDREGGLFDGRSWSPHNPASVSSAGSRRTARSVCSLR